MTIWDKKLDFLLKQVEPFGKANHLFHIDSVNKKCVIIIPVKVEDNEVEDLLYLFKRTFGELKI